MQYGRTWSVTWETCSSTLSGDGTPRFHKLPATFDAPSIVRLELSEPERPSFVRIATARKLIKRGQSIWMGKRRYPEYSLEPVVDEQGSVSGWAALFWAGRERHFYINVEAAWDGEDCDGNGSLSSVLHLRAV